MTTPVATSSSLPEWARVIVSHYNSQAYSQFILTGNVNDSFAVPGGADAKAPDTLTDLIGRHVLPRFDVILTCDVGNGIRVERGNEIFAKWSERGLDPGKSPRGCVEVLTAFLRYCANLASISTTRIRAAVVLKDSHLLCPADARMPETNALAFLVREWSREPALRRHDIATFVLAENLNELHPLWRQNPHAVQILIPIPGIAEVEAVLRESTSTHPDAMKDLQADPAAAANSFSGTTLHGLRSLLQVRQHERTPIRFDDIARIKADLIERECPGLIEFIAPTLTLNNLHGQEALKRHLRQNIVLWNQKANDVLPMGYLISGPVGTGKTFMVKCLAGEAGVPVVVLKNFRDKWYGSTEGNLEKIFRTLRALGRCYVFIDEADQTLGRRDTGGTEPAVSGRIYSMLAQEMSDKDNRGRIIWILATSRPDLVEVDLKRPGRIDLKIPLFPTSTAREGFDLLKAVAKSHKLELPEELFPMLESMIPDLMTPGETDALMTDIKREMMTEGLPLAATLQKRLTGYIKPVPAEIILHQTRLAVQECSKPEFIPERFRKSS